MNTKATKPAKGKIMEDWRKARRRVLCAPPASLSIAIPVFIKKPTGEREGYVWTRDFKTIKLRSQSFQAQAVHDPGDMPSVVSYQAKTLVGHDAGRRLYGCTITIDEDLAAEFFPFPEENKPEPFERLVALIEEQRLYGKTYAFIDDEKAMDGIKHRFLNYEREAKLDEEDQQEVLQMGADTQVGGEMYPAVPPSEYAQGQTE